jgi:hypothetical protein
MGVVEVGVVVSHYRLYLIAQFQLSIILSLQPVTDERTMATATIQDGEGEGAGAEATMVVQVQVQVLR